MIHVLVEVLLNLKIVVKEKRMKRDGNIYKAYKKELNLNTKVVKSKKQYTRKQKHKKDCR